MKKSKAILRIERVLKKINDSCFSESDIDVLFVTARELPSATKNVIEIGNFVAHTHERNQGEINEMMLRNYLYMNLAHGRDKHKIKPHLNEFPKYLPQVIKLQLKRISDKKLKESLGLKGGQIATARKRLNNNKSYEIKGDVCKLTAEIGKGELAVIQKLMSFLDCSDAIEFDAMLEDLKSSLAKEIPGVDLSLIDGNRKAIACIILCLINNVDFILKDGVKAKIMIDLTDRQSIHVYGVYPIINDEEPYHQFYISTPVFCTGYYATEIFDSKVTSDDVENGEIEYSFEAGKIVKLQR